MYHFDVWDLVTKVQRKSSPYIYIYGADFLTAFVGELRVLGEKWKIIEVINYGLKLTLLQIVSQKERIC